METSSHESDESRNLDAKIAELEALERRTTAFHGQISRILGIVAVAGFYASLRSGLDFFGIEISTSLRSVLLPISVFSGLAAAALALHHLRLVTNLRYEADLLRARKRSYEFLEEATRPKRDSAALRADGSLDGSLTSIGPTNNYFDSLVRINIENLGRYYALVRNQADKSFLVSVCAGVLGFILIAMGSFIETPSQLTTISGLLTEFISAVFFYLYSQTVRQMKEYHDSLLTVQNVLLSFKLIDDTRDETQKGAMIRDMLKYLARSNSASLQVAPVASEPTKDS
jgi:hypothetical protein